MTGKLLLKYRLFVYVPSFHLELKESLQFIGTPLAKATIAEAETHDLLLNHYQTLFSKGNRCCYMFSGFAFLPLGLTRVVFVSACDSL
jgi:hypothetical protein